MGTRGEIEMSFDVIPELPAPSRIYWVGATMGFYRHTASKNVRVLLTGSGGDNWASVGDAYAADTMRRLQLRQLLRFIYSYMDTGGLSFSTAALALSLGWRSSRARGLVHGALVTAGEGALSPSPRPCRAARVDLSRCDAQRCRRRHAARRAIAVADGKGDEPRAATTVIRSEAS